MKNIAKYLVVAAVAALSMTSCDKWLDINDSPNTPTAASAKYYNRLPFCQFYLEHSWEIPGSNAAYYSQMLVSRHNQTNGAMNWNMGAANRGNNAQQWFFVPCASNLKDMYDKAMEAGAYHYAGAAKFMRAFGFMDMIDLFGEIPYTDALGASVAPEYDTGDVVFKGCIDEIEEAIELFSKAQEDGAEPLSTGDSWNGGDANKWLKMCYLMEARWLVKLSKKGTGSYKDLKYDPDKILDCLAKAQQSNADNTIIRHTNENTSTHDHEGWDEVVTYSGVHSCIGQNNYHYWVSKMLYDNLTNFAGNGVEDPRADKIIPWVRSVKGPTTPAEVKWSPDGKWRRSLPVDLTTSIIKDNGPRYDWAWDGKWSISGADCPPERMGDTLYVRGRVGYFANSPDPLYRQVSGKDETALSGAFHLRADSPSVMASYSEACLIKAEVLFNKGQKAEAYAAYKEGVKANIEFMNDYLDTWSSFASVQGCPSFTKMSQAEVNNFLNVGLGTASDISLAKIMTQKQIVYLLTLDSWNDMRRYDYNPEVFIGFAKPYNYLNTPSFLDYCPLDKAPRRWMQASYERDYNSANLEAIGEKVSGASSLPLVKGGAWYNSKQIGTLPVWWDTAE